LVATVAKLMGRGWEQGAGPPPKNQIMTKFTNYDLSTYQESEEFDCG